jgi:hypothetical protein
MVKVEVAESEEDAYRRGRTQTKASSHAKTLPKKLIAHLPVQDLGGRGFGGMLSWMAMHAVARKGNLVARETERSHTF